MPKFAKHEKWLGSLRAASSVLTKFFKIINT